MDVNLATVESFIAVTAQRHFGRAATELGISVSAITKRIQRLEADLGVPLIERDSGGFLGLTLAGQRFIQVAPELIRAVQSARIAAMGAPHTTLRLAVPAGVGVVAPLLPAALATLELALSHAHPGVSLDPVPTPFSELTASLLSGTVDIVLTFGSSQEPEVTPTQLSEIHRVGLVSATHPLARRHSVEVEEFARLPMLYNPDLPDEYMLPFVLADVRPLDEASLVPIDAENTAHVAQRVLLGREVTVVPVALTANLPPQLRRIGLHGLPATYYFAHRRRRRPTAAAHGDPAHGRVHRFHHPSCPRAGTVGRAPFPVRQRLNPPGHPPLPSALVARSVRRERLMRTWMLVAIGAVLPLVVGGSLGSITTTVGKDTWAYPIHPTAFLLMSVGLAISHALVLVGYLEVARRTEGLGAALAKVAAAGTALVTGCELWSGAVARIHLDSPALTALDAGFAISTVVIALGTVGSGLALHRAGSHFAAPLIVNGVFLVVAALVRFFGSDGLGVTALTVWSLLYIWLALRIRSASSRGAVSTAERRAVI